MLQSCIYVHALLSTGHGNLQTMIITKRTNSDNEDFQDLARHLEMDLKRRDGEEHLVYARLNKIDILKHVVVAYDQDQAVGCGAIREFTNDMVEVKRMFVAPAQRTQGIASRILNELEAWAVELNYKICILETGKNQREAIGFYKKNKYKIIPNFGQYKNSANSVCFEKELVRSD